MKREAQLEFFIPRYGLGLVPRLSRLISCGCDAPPSGVAKWRPRGKAKRELSASLGVSLIQFAERTILAYLVLLGVGSRANRSQNRPSVAQAPFPHSYPIFAVPLAHGPRWEPSWAARRRAQVPLRHLLTRFPYAGVGAVATSERAASGYPALLFQRLPSSTVSVLVHARRSAGAGTSLVSKYQQCRQLGDIRRDP
jgi:hypothetical protein